MERGTYRVRPRTLSGPAGDDDLDTEALSRRLAARRLPLVRPEAVTRLAAYLRRQAADDGYRVGLAGWPTSHRAEIKPFVAEWEEGYRRGRLELEAGLRARRSIAREQGAPIRQRA